MQALKERGIERIEPEQDRAHERLFLVLIFAETAAQAGEQAADLAGEDEQDAGNYREARRQHLEQHPAGIWIDIHLSPHHDFEQAILPHSFSHQTSDNSIQKALLRKSVASLHREGIGIIIAGEKMATLNIPLDNETARIYQQASEEEKKKLSLLMSLWLREFDKPSQSLEKLMDRISRKARERGLTAEILNSLLNG